LAVETLPESFKYVPSLHHDDTMCELAINLKPTNFKYIDKSKQTENLCILAVSNSSENIRYVADKFKTHDILKHANIVASDIPFIPVQLRQDLILLQCEKDSFDYNLVKYLQNKSNELCNKLINKSPYTQTYIYAQYPELCNNVYSSKWSSISQNLNIENLVNLSKNMHEF